MGTARPGRSQGQTNFSAETQSNAEKRTEKGLSANLCEPLRLCVKSPQLATSFDHCRAGGDQSQSTDDP